MNDTNNLPERKPVFQEKPETPSRKFWRVVWGSMLGFLFASIITSLLYTIMFFGMIGIMAAGAKGGSGTETLKENSVLKLDLSQNIEERAVSTPFARFNNYKDNLGLDDILASIKNAASDPKIKGIYLCSGSAAASPASLKEIHDALMLFQKSGKFIYAYSDSYAQNGYYIASTADKVLLNPTGSLDLKGYAFQIMFYKNLIDKLDVDVQVIRHGKFKSAIEPYIMDKMSEANREQLDLLVNTLWGCITKDIAASRHINADTLNYIADNLLASDAQKALAYKLVDKLCYVADAEKMIKSKLDLGEDDDINFVSLGKYRKSFNLNSKASNKIAVMYAVGEIHDGKGSEMQGIYSDNFIKEFRKAYKDKDVKAIVLRINSPGGSAIASENIWQEIDRAKKAGKIVVTSMGDYAASGGYYIACNSDYIIAQPNTLTGSIGVFGMMPSFQNFLKNKVGITIDKVTTNPHADYGNGFRPMDEVEIATLQNSIEQIYGLFTQRVADGRKMSVAAVDSIGQGRVWAGQDAIGIGLVDKIGSLDDAIKKAAEMVKVSDYAIVYYPKQTDWFSMIFRNDDDIDAALRAKLGKFYFMYQGVDQILSQEGVQARMPMDIFIQ
ncbi:MAG: signal peptide peptidase SppA [Bacteroidales bacterium]|nr:signal peptide peptidase SppA [Bacteroidales bacterium]